MSFCTVVSKICKYYEDIETLKCKITLLEKADQMLDIINEHSVLNFINATFDMKLDLIVLLM